MAGKKAKWAVIITLIVVVAGLWLGAFIYFFTRDLGFGGGTDFSAEFTETVLEEGTADKVVVIEVAGVITSMQSDPLAGVASDESIVKQLEQSIEDPDVVGVIVDIDSPGGEVVASDNIYRKVLEAREAEKPVIALMGSTAASGGHYIAAGADEIVANAETLTGSIGVILTIFNVEGAEQKLGISETVIKSAPLKDIGSPFRAIEPGEMAIFQGLIDEAYNQFVDIVAEGRDLDRDEVLRAADGRVYSGRQAQKLGLVDRLGNRDDAFERAKRLAEVPDASLVRYEANVGFADLISPFARSKGDLLKQETGIDLRPGLKYLWLP